jgi:hypothetical protein
MAAPTTPMIMMFKTFILILGLVLGIAIIAYTLSGFTFTSISVELDKIWSALDGAKKGETVLIPSMNVYRSNILFQVYGSGSCLTQLSSANNLGKTLQNYGTICEGEYCICMMSWDSKDSDRYYFDTEKINGPSWWDSSGRCRAIGEIVDEKSNVDNCSDISDMDVCLNSRQPHSSGSQQCYWDLASGDIYMKYANDMLIYSHLSPSESSIESTCSDLLQQAFIESHLTGLHCRPLGFVGNAPVYVQKPTLDNDPKMSE